MWQFFKCCSQGNNALLNPTLDKFHTWAANSISSRICNCQAPKKSGLFCNTNHLCFHSSFPVLCVSTSDLCLVAIGLTLFFSRKWQAAAWKGWLRVQGFTFLSSRLQLCFSKLPSIIIAPHLTRQPWDIRPLLCQGLQQLTETSQRANKTNPKNPTYKTINSKTVKSSKATAVWACWHEYSVPLSALLIWTH